jgi:WD40 repeat protein
MRPASAAFADLCISASEFARFGMAIMIYMSSLQVALWDLGHGGERSRTIDVSGLTPGRRARLFPVADDGDVAAFDVDVYGSASPSGRRSLTIVDSDSPGSSASVIDLRTGRSVRSFGERCPAVQSSSRLAGRLMCRQRSIYDVATGLEVTSFDRLAPGSGFLVVALQSLSDCRRVLIGGQGFTTRLFNIDTGALLATLDSGDGGSSTPSAVALTDDGRLAFVGYADTCRLGVFDVDRDSIESTGVGGCRMLTLFDYRSVIVTGVAAHSGKPHIKFPIIEEVAELAVNSINNSQVLMNVSQRQLIVYDVSAKVGTPMAVTSLR